MKNKKTIFIVLILAIIVVGGFIILAPPPVPVPLVGHVHQTSGGGFRGTQAAFVEGQFDEPVRLYATGSGDLRAYMTVALARGSIERGTLFSYNHREVHQQFEAARPFIAEFPDRYPVRREFAALADPLGELHLVWVDAYVIIYNPDLIAREDVPSTLADVANWGQPIGVPTTGCLGTWGTMAIFYHLGEAGFRSLMANAEVIGSLGDVTGAVKDGTIAVGISTLLDVRVRDGQVGVLWPEEGAIAKPGLLVIPDNPTEYHLRLADIIMSPEAANLHAREFNMASALPGGPVPTIVEENNFHFVFIPAEAIICLDLEATVNQIVGG